MKKFIILFSIIFITCETLVFSQETSKIPQDSSIISIDTAFTYYYSIIDHNKKSTYAYYGLAQCYYKIGDYKNAIKMCKNGLALEGEYQQELTLWQAKAIDASGFPDKAAKFISDALNRFPGNFEMMYYQSLFYYKISDFENAKRSALHCIDTAPTFPQGHLMLSVIMFEQKNDQLTPLPLYYSLFVTQEEPWARNAFDFLNALLFGEHESFIIPIKEKRYKLSSVEDILSFYFKNGTKDMEKFFSSYEFYMRTKEYLEQVSSSLEEVNSFNKTYQPLFTSLSKSEHINTFCSIISLSFEWPEAAEWIKKNPQKLESFAKWLESFTW